MVAGGQVSAGDFYRNLISGHDLIIGADSGADAVRALGLAPDIIVGDLDSISPETLAWAKGNNVAVRQFPPEKDKTDLELALEEAVARGADEITLTGAWGGRIDQTLANLFLLRAAKDKGVVCAIRESAGEIFLVDKALTVLGESGDTVSLLALEDARGVALEGLKYMISDGLLAVGSTLGVSNELVGNQGKIELQSGLILVIISRGTYLDDQ